MKKDFDEICICLDNAIQYANGKLSLQTKIGTFVNLEKRENGNYKITFNTDKETYESITKDNLYKFLFENWRGNPNLGRDDSRLTLFEAIKDFIQTNCQNINKEKKEFKMQNNQPLNQILFGPPGTGKTFNTINKAIEIIENRVLSSEELKPENRENLKTIFEDYKKAGQIEFVTFHQSYGYEEFVEGIKAIPVGKEGNEYGTEMIYDISDGIFKKLCKKVLKDKLFYLGQFIGKYEIIGLSDELLKLKRESGSIIPIPIYLLNEILDLLNRNIITIDDVNNKTAIEKMSISAEKFIINGYPNVFRDLAQYYLDNKDKESKDIKNHILIIDEINRGNISKIFGELITLIEPSKRIGADEEIKVKLPYSNDDFGVPQNLYILGTMNTADRSIALMDTALRRRFEFIEMLPDLAVLSNNNEKVKDFNSYESQDNDLIVNDINIRLLLQKINQRVEYLYDRDHTIGHAYFISLKDKIKNNDGILRDKTEDEKLIELESIFKNKIIPLLQEYFYDDWEKIRLVLGDNQKDENYQFIKTKKYDIKSLFGDKNNDLLDIDEVPKIYEINKEAFKDSQSYVKIYSK